MKKLLHWMGRVAGSAVTLALVIVLLPYVSRLTAAVMPDLSGLAVKTCATLSQTMTGSARLETAVVDEEGVLSNELNALFLGSVASLTMRYQYHASVGIDLTRVQMRVSGRKITFLLPPLEVLSDSITPVETVRDDFWYGYGFDDKTCQALLEQERAACREKWLADTAQSDALWEKTEEAFRSTITGWLDASAGRSLTFEFIQQNGAI